MLNKFWESLGENLAGEWLKYVFSPAFLFWAGGVGMYTINHGWQTSWQWLTTLQVVEQVALLLIALLVLVLSLLVMQHLRFNILRLLEGYWPWPIRKLADKISDLKNRRREVREIRWNKLKNSKNVLTRREARKLVKLDLHAHYFPILPKDVMPTKLGNILSAAETAPFHKYGLDAFVCWPRLWLVLPAHVRTELNAARNRLMTLVVFCAWGLLFFAWSAWSLWAVATAVFWVWLSYSLALRAAMTYADLLESAFDLYRWALYKAAHWPLPQKAGNTEVIDGQKLTEFFWRGEAASEIQYETKEDK